LSARSERETGDRAVFIDRLNRRIAQPVPANPAHPLPPPLDELPSVRSSLLDSSDVIGSFVRNATGVRVIVHEVAGSHVPPDVLADIVERHSVEHAVVSREPEAVSVGDALRAAGVAVHNATIDTCAAADLGVTGATAAIATTGTLVLRSDTTGSRSASLLPPVHLCVLAAGRIVPTSTDVLAGLGATVMPSNIVLITGPSRSGDIEQIITVGVHGPPVVEVVLLRGA
jgi:L-lactate dehydrogenase complex protein LldG